MSKEQSPSFYMKMKTTCWWQNIRKVEEMTSCRLVNVLYWLSANLLNVNISRLVC